MYLYFTQCFTYGNTYISSITALNFNNDLPLGMHTFAIRTDDFQVSLMFGISATQVLVGGALVL
jgi:hypothetical protein